MEHFNDQRLRGAMGGKRIAALSVFALGVFAAIATVRAQDAATTQPTPSPIVAAPPPPSLADARPRGFVFTGLGGNRLIYIDPGLKVSLTTVMSQTVTLDRLVKPMMSLSRLMPDGTVTTVNLDLNEVWNDPAKDVVVQAGDVGYVYEASPDGKLPDEKHPNPGITVVGEVSKPGFIPIRPMEVLTLGSALRQTGGHTRFADPAVTITRLQPDGSKTSLQANLHEDPINFSSANLNKSKSYGDIPLQDGDEVRIDRATSGNVWPGGGGRTGQHITNSYTVTLPPNQSFTLSSALTQMRGDPQHFSPLVAISRLQASGSVMVLYADLRELKNDPKKDILLQDGDSFSITEAVGRALSNDAYPPVLSSDVPHMAIEQNRVQRFAFKVTVPSGKTLGLVAAIEQTNNYYKNMTFGSGHMLRFQRTLTIPDGITRYYPDLTPELNIEPTVIIERAKPDGSGNVTQTVDWKQAKTDPSKDAQLQDGDVVLVDVPFMPPIPNRIFYAGRRAPPTPFANMVPIPSVLVAGEIERKGPPIPIPEGKTMKLSEAIQQAKLTPLANHVVTLYRYDENDKVQAQKVDVDDILKKGQTDKDVDLRPGDAIDVRTNWVE